MNEEERVLNLISKNNGILKVEQLKQINVNNITLTRLIKKGLVERVARGMYIDINTIEDSYYIFQYKCPKAIFSHSTALYFHDLSDRTPIKFMITVPTKYNSRLLKDKKYVFSYLKKELYEIGKIKIKTAFQNEVYCYDMERTICDIVRDKDKIDPALFADAMKRYIDRKDKKINKLYEYAEKFNIKNEIRKYVEVLL